jgi:hypothetical protein
MEKDKQVNFLEKIRIDCGTAGESMSSGSGNTTVDPVDRIGRRNAPIWLLASSQVRAKECSV